MRISQNNQNRGYPNMMGLLICLITWGTTGIAQTQTPSYETIAEKVSISYNLTTADQLLKHLDAQTTYDFIYQEEEFKKISLSGLEFTNTTLGNVLSYL